MLCKVILYAYSRGITSSQKMGRQCEENLAFRFLTGGQCPDHRTHLLRWVFRKTVPVAREMGIAKLGLLAIDSIKIQADGRASRKQTVEELREQLKQWDAYFGKLEETDQKENQQLGEGRGDELPQKLQQDQRRRDVLPADPEAAWVKKQGRIIAGYSGQVAADGESQIIVWRKLPRWLVNRRSELFWIMVIIVMKLGCKLPKALCPGWIYGRRIQPSWEIGAAAAVS